MNQINLVDFFRILVKWRKFIYANIVIVTLVAVIISLVSPYQYSSSARLIPVIEAIGTTSETASLLARIPLLGSLGGLATPSDLYAGILSGRVIKEKIIEKFDLMKYYRARNLDDAIEKLNKKTKIEKEPTGIITITVTDENPDFAATLANAFVEELDKFNREAIMTRGKKTRLFIEKRLKEIEADLKALEDSLKKFQKEKRVFDVEEETKLIMGVYTDLKAQYLKKEIERDLLKEIASPNYPRLKDLERELKELENQIRKIEEDTTLRGYGIGFAVPLKSAPEVEIRFAQLKRDYKIKSEVYAFLIQQYEEAKILEKKDTPTLQVIDKAKPASLRSWPKRKFIVITAFIISLIISIILVLIFELISRLKGDEWSSLLETIRRDFSLKRKS